MFKISVTPPIQSAVNLHRGAWGLCLCLKPFLPETTNFGHHPPTSTYPSCQATARGIECTQTFLHGAGQVSRIDFAHIFNLL